MSGDRAAALREAVWRANQALVEAGLVTLSFGNASGIDRDRGIMLIKPSGVPYAELRPEHLVGRRHRRWPGRRRRPPAVVRHADPSRALPALPRASAASCIPIRRRQRRGRRPAGRSRPSGRRTPTISTAPSRSRGSSRMPRSPASTRPRPGSVIVETLDAGRARRRRTCRPSWSPRTGRSRGARTPPRPRTTRSPSSSSRRMARRDVGPRPGRATDACLPARASLPAQARVDRVLRPAADVTDDDRAEVARLHGAGDVRHRRASRLAARGPDEVLLRVTAVGLCGSDLHWYREGAIGDAGLERSARARPRVQRRHRRRAAGRASGSSPIRPSRAACASRAGRVARTCASTAGSRASARPMARSAR